MKILLALAFISTAAAASPKPLDFAGMPLGTTKMATVAKRFGEAPRWKTGDASEAEDKFCYRINTLGQSWFVYFISGELDYGGKMTGSVRISRETEIGHACVKPRRGAAVLAAAVADYVGLSESNLSHRLKAFPMKQDRSGSWGACRKTRIDGKEFGDCISVMARYRHRRLWELNFSTAVTN